MGLPRERERERARERERSVLSLRRQEGGSENRELQ